MVFALMKEDAVTGFFVDGNNPERLQVIPPLASSA
jgi:hypothetical protein